MCVCVSLDALIAAHVNPCVCVRERECVCVCVCVIRCIDSSSCKPVCVSQGSFHSPLDSSRSTRHHGLVERVHRDRHFISPSRPYTRQVSFPSQSLLQVCVCVCVWSYHADAVVSLTSDLRRTALTAAQCICLRPLTPAGEGNVLIVRLMSNKNH